MSTERLMQCHKDLQTLFNEVVKDFDCTVTCGYRGEKEQNEAFAKGTTKKKYPDSKHNKIPSLAVDVMPYPIDWKDVKRMYYFAGYVMAKAKQLKDSGAITNDIRWGGDWNQNQVMRDENFIDCPHFEIVI